MYITKHKLGEVVHLIALFAAMIGSSGWAFWLLTLGSSVTFAQLRVDPEMGSVVALAVRLSYVAPLAFIMGVLALLWRPRYIALVAIVLGAIGTCWLAFVA